MEEREDSRKGEKREGKVEKRSQTRDGRIRREEGKNEM